MVLPSHDLSDATTISQSICRVLMGETARESENELPRLSVSIGVVATCEHDANVEELLKRADQLMYRAKDATRGKEPRASAVAIDGQEPLILE